MKEARTHSGWVLAGATAVLLWRAAAWRWPSKFIDLPDGLRLPIGLLGVLFVACGVWAWWARPGRRTRVFLLYGLGGGVHWGGAIDAPGAELSLLMVYLATSALGEAALLHLALIYPRGARFGRWRLALYAPAALALALAPLAGVLARPTLETAIGLLLMTANAFGLIAGLIFLVRLFAADPATRRAARLPLVAGGILFGGLLSMLGAGGLLFGEPEAWNLTLAALPIGLAIALVTRDRLDLREPAQSNLSAPGS